MTRLGDSMPFGQLSRVLLQSDWAIWATFESHFGRNWIISESDLPIWVTFESHFGRNRIISESDLPIWATL